MGGAATRIHTGPGQSESRQLVDLPLHESQEKSQLVRGHTLALAEFLSRKADASALGSGSITDLRLLSSRLQNLHRPRVRRVRVRLRFECRSSCGTPCLRVDRQMPRSSFQHGQVCAVTKIWRYCGNAMRWPKPLSRFTPAVIKWGNHRNKGVMH